VTHKDPGPETSSVLALNFLSVNLDYVRSSGIRSVEANIVYAIATKL
jgi:hypothetical protein